MVPTKLPCAAQFIAPCRPYMRKDNRHRLFRHQIKPTQMKLGLVSMISGSRGTKLNWTRRTPGMVFNRPPDTVQLC